MGTSTRVPSNPRTPSALECAEIARSAGEASKYVSNGIDHAQVKRYLDPPASTPYPLEYAFHLLGDIRNKNVLDLGCGKGENMVPLTKRGANITGIDISPDLIQLAQQRIVAADISARAVVGSAYDTGLENESIDVILCVALIHHLDIPRVRDEMYRILKPGGFIVLTEPVRFSKTYDLVRKILPAQEDTSESEHPLTMQELDCIGGAFTRENQRLFRLPFVAIPERLFRKSNGLSYKLSDWIIQTWPVFEQFATIVVVRLQKKRNV
jgi:SAM-dependent methyltransferase